MDLGCGYGPIALTLARRHPSATVWAVDVNERALELCRANAAALGLDIVPDSLTPELIGRILNGETVKPRERGTAPSGKPKKRKSTTRKKKIES